MTHYISQLLAISYLSARNEEFVSLRASDMITSALSGGSFRELSSGFAYVKYDAFSWNNLTAARRTILSMFFIDKFIGLFLRAQP